MESLSFDVVVLGGGPGGTPAANYLSAHGLKVAIVEMGEGLGGVCLFKGCIPSKIYIETATRFYEFKQDDIFGIEGGIEQLTIDLNKIKQRKREILGIRVNGASKLSAALGTKIFKGVGHISGSDTIDVITSETNYRLNFKSLIIALGSTGVQLPIEGAELCKPVEDIFEIEALPRSVVMIGGGYIGIEMASMFARLGVKSTIIEFLPRVLSTEDVNVSSAVLEGLKELGIDVYLNSKVTSVKEANGKKIVQFLLNNELQNVNTDYVVMAVGRRPDTDNLNLDVLGITKGKHGEIPVNEFMQTSNKNVYACGDINGKMMLAHAATAESLVAANKILGNKTEINYSAIPHAIFGYPESASVGLNSTEATEKGYRTFKFSYSQDAKALIEGDSKGFVQMIVDPVNLRLLGTQIVGKNASELITEPTQIISKNGTIKDILSSVHTHPTLNEVISETANYIMGQLSKTI